MLAQNAVVLAKDFHDNLTPFEIPIRIDSVKRYLLSKHDLEFTKFLRVSWQAKLIYGRMRRYEKGESKWTEIAVSDSLNNCWTRYITCKEISHLFISNFGDDPLEEIRQAMEPFVAVEEEMMPEKWATIAALEFLVPWRTRGDVSKMIEAGTSNYDIAKKYLVPERVIDMWRSPGYQSTLSKLWDGMEVDHERIPPQ